MKERYEELQSEVIAFEKTDVIVTSYPTKIDQGGDTFEPGA